MKTSNHLLAFALALAFPAIAGFAQDTPAVDKPSRGKAYRLTYTIVESEGTKVVASQRYTMQALDGGAHLKIGSRVPIPAGSYRAGTSTGVQTQFSYYDVGLNIDATISTEGSSVNLRSHVEQTSLVPTDDKAEGPPVVRQSTFEDSSRVTPAKTAVIGSFDVPGTNRHVELQVLLEESR